MPTVCVIDDNAIALNVVKSGLTALGWNVVCFDNALGVAFKIKQLNPAVVLVDVNMPRLSGQGLMRTLTSRVGPQNAKLLLHSDQPEEVLRTLASQTGAHGYTKKTSDPRALDMAIRRFL